MWLLYEVLLYLTFVLALPFFLLAGVLRGKYLVNFPERMGVYRSPAAAHDLWIHAVSVGETLAAKTIVAEILRLRPDTSIVFTTTTLTGQAQAKRLFPHATVTYFPFDFAWSVRRFLDHHRPRAFATMETEIWPNVTRLARARGMRLVLANGRLSDRSFPRYRVFRGIVGRILLRYDRILAREPLDRERFIAIGAPESIVETSGNVKFDYTPGDHPLEIAPRLEALIAGRPTIVLGSTMEGEDEELLPELERFVRERNVFAIVAPRKPERFEIVAGLLATTSLTAVRRSELSNTSLSGAATDQPSVLLLDSFGELARIYHYGQVAFIGGSLKPGTGGHNPIEAAAAGVPVCFGPYMSNFREIAAVFLRDGGAAEVRNATDLFALAGRMLDDATEREGMGGRARKTVEQNRGASARTAQRIVEILS
jgi:3-deoxy-D-manno-octulosonic-acid transferase